MLLMHNEIPVFPFPQTENALQSLRIIHLDSPPSYNYPEAHRHDYFEIFMFSKGSGKHLIDFEEHPIQSNSVHLVMPGQVHLVKRSHDSQAKIVIFSFELFNLLQLPTHYSEAWKMNPVQQLGSEDYAELKGLVDLIHNQHVESKQPGGIVQSLLQAFLLKLLAFVPEDKIHPSTPAKRHYLEFQRLVEEFYIKWHFPSDYADRMGLTEKHLNEVIKIQSSKSAGLIIRERILLEAKRLLFNSDWNAKEISYHLQFSDPAYFNRFFKRMTGDTPQFFRQESRKKFQHM